MTNQIVAHEVLAMSSKEVAELTGKAHSHVIRDIKVLAGQLYDDPNLDHVDHKGVFAHRDSRGYVSEICLDKDHTLTLLTGYDAKARMKVVRRWQELEANAVVSLPQTYLDALKALVAAEEAKAALAVDNALLNTIIDNEFGYCSILRAAQHLGVHETAFNWRPLKKQTLLMGLDVKQVPSPRYEYQNLYPIAAFAHCYPQYDFSGLQPEAVTERSMKLLSGSLMSAMH